MTNPPTPPVVISITGTKCAGKDTLLRHLQDLNPACVRYAFADRLKQDTAPLIREQFDYDPDNLTPEQKEIVRPLYIGYGMAQRAKDPLHWVKIVLGDIDHRWAWCNELFIPVVTDVRFENEASCLRERYGSAFRLINVTRAGGPAPTDEEQKHFRQVAAMADYNLDWGHDSPAQQRQHALRILDWLGVDARSEVTAA